MAKNNSWQTISSKCVYENPWIRVREDAVITPAGKNGIYGVVEGRPFVMLIPKIRDVFTLVEVYRYPIGLYSIEFPAGGIEEGESAEQAAQRELMEEIGMMAAKLTKLGFLYTSNGFSTVAFHVILAEDMREAKASRDDFEEDMQIRQFSSDELLKMIKNGSITDSPTVSALGLYLLHHNSVSDSTKTK